VTAGYARHRVSTTYFASSTGLRLRHPPPDGKVELVVRAADGTRSSWAGQGAGDFRDVTLDDLEDQLYHGLRWSERRMPRPAGRYEIVLPPEAVADLVVWPAMRVPASEPRRAGTSTLLRGTGPE
jgi:predicted Zn-dependent protease